MAKCWNPIYSLIRFHISSSHINSAMQRRQTTLLSHFKHHSVQINTTAVAYNEVKPDDEDMLHITDSCIKQLKKVAEDDEYLRVIVEGGGCSGFTYKFELDKTVNDDDRIFQREGVKVVTDDVSLDLIKGSHLDYSEELIRRAFRITSNPQSKTNCSCGVSFSIDI